jgi:hypothetical protein
MFSGKPRIKRCHYKLLIKQNVKAPFIYKLRYNTSSYITRSFCHFISVSEVLFVTPDFRYSNPFSGKRNRLHMRRLL